MRAKTPHGTTNEAKPDGRFAFTKMAMGVWGHKNGSLVYEEKFEDGRRGYIIFGQYELVVYLEASTHPEFNWPCRLDIHYGSIEHAIPSIEPGNRGAITFTLKSPPKIFRMTNQDDVHLYNGQFFDEITALLGSMAGLNVGRGPKKPDLERLCALHPSYDQTSALCMVYKLSFPNLPATVKAWAFMKDFGVAEKYLWQPLRTLMTRDTIETDYGRLDLALTTYDFGFPIQFQIMALVLEGTLTPSRMMSLLATLQSLSLNHDTNIVAQSVRRLGSQISTPTPDVEETYVDDATIRQLVTDNVLELEMIELTKHGMMEIRGYRGHLALTSKATITPTGLLLRGPDWDISNRILRKYQDYTEYFMRVTCAEEDGLSVFFDPRASQDAVYNRFTSVFVKGIKIAGRHFEFLGFSHASLREHQAWLMAPFFHDGKLIRARDVIKDLGDFDDFVCSAKCAARIGQAFSDTIFAVRVPSSAYVIETKDDIERNGRCFSDGCGTISLDLLKTVWKKLPPGRRKKRPTILQIRFRGAKGVLSLDTSLAGEQLHVRKSMTKFIAKDDWKDIEICEAAYTPLTFFLNHQFVKILEDLGVPAEQFIAVQKDACRDLELVIQHPLNAANFLEYSHSGVIARIPRLIQLLHFIGISFHADKFLTDIIEVAAMSSLRSLKYRARIPIKNARLLFGIMDETNTLQEGEVYISMYQEKNDGEPLREILVGDRVVVTRAPALHPGDVQIVKAVDVPEGNPLRALHNCIVFSQKGARDLPSQLAGGDLDGDKFHVLWDPRLMPTFTVPPADYASVPPHNLGRPVEVGDIIQFFVEFMQMDRLGQISNKHKIRADKFANGTHNADCIKLAQLASDAVDFSKSGIPANMAEIARGSDHLRPDWMASGPNLIINSMGAAELEELEEDDVDEPDNVRMLNPDKQRIRYYRSDKVLGKLYRNINEAHFFRRMKAKFQSLQPTSEALGVMHRLESYIDRETQGFLWEHHREFAEGLREFYETNMIEIMDTLRPHRGHPLTELEVVSGNILAKKERASTRHINEANQAVRDRFDRDVGAIIRSITTGEVMEEEDDDGQEELPRAIACFKVALETEGWDNQVLLRSWKYITASVCLEQLSHYRGGNLKPV